MNRVTLRDCVTHTHTHIHTYTQKALESRQRTYKQSALHYKRAGDLASAAVFVRAVRELDPFLNRVKEGVMVDMGMLPPVPITVPPPRVLSDGGGGGCDGGGAAAGGVGVGGGGGGVGVGGGADGRADAGAGPGAGGDNDKTSTLPRPPLRPPTHHTLAALYSHLESSLERQVERWTEEYHRAVGGGAEGGEWERERSVFQQELNLVRSMHTEACMVPRCVHPCLCVHRYALYSLSLYVYMFVCVGIAGGHGD